MQLTSGGPRFASPLQRRTDANRSACVVKPPFIGCRLEHVTECNRSSDVSPRTESAATAAAAAAAAAVAAAARQRERTERITNVYRLVRTANSFSIERY
jgi:hypothetical protein